MILVPVADSISTDAVLRYLLVQYGVTPHELLAMEDGALIGDVL